MARSVAGIGLGRLLNGMADGRRRIVRRLLLRLDRSRQRRALGRLDDHLLRDIGISRAAAAREARQPFWR